MIKQIFDKLPRKHSKSHHKDQSINGGLPASSHTKTVSVRNNNNSKSNLSPLKHLNLAAIGAQRASDVVLHRHKSSSISKKSIGVAATVTTTVPLSPAGVKKGCLELVSGGSYDPLPGFCDVPNDERDDLFRKKLSMCCVVFDFSDLLKNQSEKEVKRKTLMELVDYVSSASYKFSEAMIHDSTHMVGVNLFRSLHLLNREVKVMDMYDAEEEELTMEPAWPHLQLVHEFFHRFVASSENDTKISKRYVDQHFISRLLDLFDSEDQRERECLKTTLHRIYGKFMVHRPFIRKSINNIFYQFIFETEKHNGIAELLEILGSIINGFALPLKEEHKLFLVRALIPLHKSRGMSLYHQQLSYSITQFVEKDFKLADTVIRGLLKYWPITNSSKEVMFLGELEEVLEATQTAEFQRCMVSLAHQLARCASSSHFQVAERALFLWNNEHIRGLLTHERKAVLPILFPALERNSKGHWNQAVRSLTLNVLKIFHDTDPTFFAECQTKFQEAETGMKEAEIARELTWKRLEDMAAVSGSAAVGPTAVRGFLSSFVSTAASGRRVAAGR